MKLPLRFFCTILLSITLIAIGPAWLCAQEQGAPPPPGQAGGQALSPADIDTLMAPIALYPDPLISQILPAATYPDDVQAAANWLAQNPNNPEAIDAQSWDVSVKAVAHYPQVLQKMSGDMDWTLALGQAYSTQQEDVLQSVQRLRQTAQNAGTLQSTPQQRVMVEDNSIRIVPADPRMVYVPSYDPEVVYVAGPPHRRGLMGFTAGFMIGSWLNSDLDWRRHRVYYHGWNGPGWISYSRPYIHANRYYVNDGYRNRMWVNQHPRYHGSPMVRNRVYVDRHINRYEFNRNRVNRDMHRPDSAMGRINAARDHGRSTTTVVGGHGYNSGRSTTTVVGGHGRTTQTTTVVGGHGRTTQTTTVVGGHGRTTSNTTTVVGGHGRTSGGGYTGGGHTTTTTTSGGGHIGGGRTMTNNTSNSGHTGGGRTMTNNTSGGGHTGGGRTTTTNTSGGAHTGGGRATTTNTTSSGHSGGDTKKKR